MASGNPMTHLVERPAAFSSSRRLWDASCGLMFRVNVAVPGVATPASYVRAVDSRQVVSSCSMVESSPVIEVGQPTCTTEQSSGSKKYSSVPAVRISISFHRWDTPPHGGVCGCLMAVVSVCAQTESGASVHEELGSKTDAPQPGGRLEVLTVPCDDVVVVILDRIPQCSGDGPGGTHALGVAIDLNAHHVLGRRAGQRVRRRAVHKLVHGIRSILILRRGAKRPEPDWVRPNERSDCRAVLGKLEDIWIHQVIPSFRSSLSISAGAAATTA